MGRSMRRVVREYVLALPRVLRHVVARAPFRFVLWRFDGRHRFVRAPHGHRPVGLLQASLPSSSSSVAWRGDDGSSHALSYHTIDGEPSTSNNRSPELQGMGWAARLMSTNVNQPTSFSQPPRTFCLHPWNPPCPTSGPRQRARPLFDEDRSSSGRKREALGHDELNSTEER